MDVVSLVSGGKDSCYNTMCAIRDGHTIVALANLHPPHGVDELDSYMYQSVGANAVKLYSEAIGIPLYTREIRGTAKNTEFAYEETSGDEVEDLYELLREVQQAHPTVKGVSAGAILSSYQKIRVEHVCSRLGLTPLCYLWERDQNELLDEMIENDVEALLVKVAAAGLGPQHLGRSIKQMRDTLFSLSKKFGVHPCGEGGEYETFVVDCPLFKKRIVFDHSEVVTLQEDEMAPVAILRMDQLHLVEKSNLQNS